MNRPLDDGFFVPQAEGNIPVAPNSYMRSPTVRRGGDASWSVPRITRQSILSRSMRSMSCPPVTLNSFAALTTPTVQVDTSSSVQAPATTGNSIVDAISGALGTVAKAGATNITADAAAGKTGKGSKKLQDQLMQQFLQGNLPGYTVNPNTGELQPKSSFPVVPIVAVGIGAIALFWFFKSRR